MNLFFKAISCLILILGVASVIVYGKKNGKSEKFFKKSLISIVFISVFLFIFSDSFTIIPTGYTGVRSTFEQIDNVTVQNGFNWKIPFVQKINLVNNKQQDLDFHEEQIWSETSNRTAISYQGIIVTYQINSEKSAWIYANVSNYKDYLVTNNLVTSSIKSSSKNLADTDATNRAIVEPLVMENLQKSLDEKYGEDVVFINKVTIKDIDFEKSYNEAIAAKQQAQLKAEQQEIENKAAIDKANTDAQVKRTAAQAEAEANKLLEQSLTSQILQQQYIEKWDGKLPNVVAGEDASTIISLPTE